MYMYTLYVHVHVGLAEIRAKAIKKRYEERLIEAREKGEPIEEPPESSDEEEDKSSGKEEDDTDNEEQKSEKEEKNELMNGETLYNDPPPLEDVPIDTQEEDIPYIKPNPEKDTFQTNGQSTGVFSSQSHPVESKSTHSALIIADEWNSSNVDSTGTSSRSNVDSIGTSSRSKQVVIELVEEVGRGLEDFSTIENLRSTDKSTDEGNTIKHNYMYMYM